MRPGAGAAFSRKGISLAVTRDPADYRPGDLATWMLPGNLPHIGIVADRRSADGLRPLIVHNIGRGPQLEDVLFEFPVTGHYRYPSLGLSPNAVYNQSDRMYPLTAIWGFFHATS